MEGMLYLIYGTDREKVRSSLAKALAPYEKKGTRTVRITDAHQSADLESALMGPGLFGEKQVVVFEGVIGGNNVEMSARLVTALPALQKSDDDFYLTEGALLADMRKVVEKHAEKAERFDTKSAKEYPTVFGLADALARGDKKALWVGLMHEYEKGNAPEAIHGVLFWGVKKQVSSARDTQSSLRARRLMKELVALPHDARRRGEDLSYALERFALSLS